MRRVIVDLKGAAIENMPPVASGRYCRAMRRSAAVWARAWKNFGRLPSYLLSWAICPRIGAAPRERCDKAVNVTMGR